jgi:hypothetical protein
MRGEEPDPWAEADAEAAALSAGNMPAVDPWAEADAEAAALASAPDAADDEIIPLDWDFDPSTATGATEIQDEIDSIINADSKPETDGGRG